MLDIILFYIPMSWPSFWCSSHVFVMYCHDPRTAVSYFVNMTVNIYNCTYTFSISCSFEVYLVTHPIFKFVSHGGIDFPQGFSVYLGCVYTPPHLVYTSQEIGFWGWRCWSAIPISRGPIPMVGMVALLQWLIVRVKNLINLILCCTVWISSLLDGFLLLLRLYLSPTS